MVQQVRGRVAERDVGLCELVDGSREQNAGLCRCASQIYRSDQCPDYWLDYKGWSVACVTQQSCRLSLALLNESLSLADPQRSAAGGNR